MAPDETSTRRRVVPEELAAHLRAGRESRADWLNDLIAVANEAGWSERELAQPLGVKNPSVHGRISRATEPGRARVRAMFNIPTPPPKPKPKPRRVPGVLRPRVTLDMEAISREYLRGDSLPILGRRYGCNHETIRRHLMAAAVPIRDVSAGMRARYGRRGDLAGLAADLDLDEQRLLDLLLRHGFIPEESDTGR